MMFNMMDANKNGEISAEELTATYKKYGMSDKSVTAIVNATMAYAGADHEINKEEYNKMANAGCAIAQSH